MQRRVGMTLLHCIWDLSWDNLNANNDTQQLEVRIIWRFLHLHVCHLGCAAFHVTWLPHSMVTVGYLQSSMASQAYRHVCSVLGMRWKHHCPLRPSLRSLTLFSLYFTVESSHKPAQIQGKGTWIPISQWETCQGVCGHLQNHQPANNE